MQRLTEALSNALTAMIVLTMTIVTVAIAGF